MSKRVPVLTLLPDTAFFIVLKTREFHTKVDPVDPDEGSNPADDKEIDVLQFGPDDNVVEELVSAIGSLDQDQLAELVALIWLGRGDYAFAQWAQAREAARGMDPDRVLAYLLGMPQVSSYLEDGLAFFGHDLKTYLNSGFVAARDELFAV